MHEFIRERHFWSDRVYHDEHDKSIPQAKMKQFKKMLYIEDVPLSVWLQSHPNLLNDI